MQQELISLWAEVTKEDNRLNLFFSPKYGVIWFTIDPNYNGTKEAIMATEHMIDKLDRARAIAVDYLYKLKNPKEMGDN